MIWHVCLGLPGWIRSPGCPCLVGPHLPYSRVCRLMLAGVQGCREKNSVTGLCARRQHRHSGEGQSEDNRVSRTSFWSGGRLSSAQKRGPPFPPSLSLGCRQWLCAGISLDFSPTQTSWFPSSFVPTALGCEVVFPFMDHQVGSICS